MAGLDRTELLEVLASLADADDGSVAAAGREATALLTAADLDWADVIAAQSALDALQPAAPAEDGEPVSTTAANAEDAKLLIDRLLARDNLFDGTRDELQAYKEDIETGEFDDTDLAYLNALYARVVAAKVKGSN